MARVRNMMLNFVPPKNRPEKINWTSGEILNLQRNI